MDTVKSGFMGLKLSEISGVLIGTISIKVRSFWKGHKKLKQSEIQSSQYIRPKVTVHKCEETIQGGKLYEEIW